MIRSVSAHVKPPTLEARGPLGQRVSRHPHVLAPLDVREVAPPRELIDVGRRQLQALGHLADRQPGGGRVLRRGGAGLSGHRGGEGRHGHGAAREQRGSRLGGQPDRRRRVRREGVQTERGPHGSSLWGGPCRSARSSQRSSSRCTSG
jgi:hypothetical protein